MMKHGTWIYGGKRKNIMKHLNNWPGAESNKVPIQIVKRAKQWNTVVSFNTWPGQSAINTRSQSEYSMAKCMDQSEASSGKTHANAGKTFWKIKRISGNEISSSSSCSSWTVPGSRTKILRNQNQTYHHVDLAT